MQKKFNELFPSSLSVSAAHTSSYGGSATGGSVTANNSGLLYRATTKDADKYTGFYGSAWGEGSYHYTNPLPKGLKSVSVSFTVWGTGSTNVYVTNSSGQTIASGSSSVNLSSYTNSNENLYLHVSASSHFEENVGANCGSVSTYASINSISLKYGF